MRVDAQLGLRERRSVSEIDDVGGGGLRVTVCLHSAVEGAEQSQAAHVTDDDDAAVGGLGEEGDGADHVVQVVAVWEVMDD